MAKPMAQEKFDGKTTAARLFFAAIIIIGWALIFLYFRHVTYLESIVRFVLLYIFTVLFLNVFKTNKTVRLILKALWIPGILFIAFYPFVFSLLSVILSYGIVYTLTVLIFEILPVDLFHYHFTKALDVYLKITISSIVVAYYYDKVVGFWEYILFHRIREGGNKFSYKLMNQSRAKFSIYFFYFIALLILNISRFNGMPVIPSETMEKAILESFATFLAFERITTNWNLFVEEKLQQ